MKKIKVNMTLSVPESVSDNLVSVYFDDIAAKLNLFLQDYISDEDEVELDGVRVYE